MICIIYAIFAIYIKYTILFQAVVVCLHFPSNNFGADHSILLGTDF